METNDEVELRVAQDTPELRRLAAAWDKAAVACNIAAMADAEEAMLACSKPARRVTMDEWRKLDASSGGSGGCLLDGAGLPAGEVYVCIPVE